MHNHGNVSHSDSSLGSNRKDTLQHRLLGLRWRSQGLVRYDVVALIVEEREVGESSTDVDTNSIGHLKIFLCCLCIAVRHLSTVLTGMPSHR